jgi:hypothetical protein
MRTNFVNRAILHESISVNRAGKPAVNISVVDLFNVRLAIAGKPHFFMKYR